MTREIGEDFSALETFIANYHIDRSAMPDQFLRLMKQGHKKLFGLMSFIVELDHLHALTCYSRDSRNFLNECTSDVAQSLFCWMHGAYKPSHLSLRSSIETFTKGLVGTEIPSIFSEKSLYAVFDTAKDSDACSGAGQKQFQTLRGEYAVLCTIAHTAKAGELTQVNALKIFPTFEPTEATALISRFTKTIDCYLALLLINNRSQFPRMHFKNRNNIIQTMSKDAKREILGVDFNN